MSSSTKKTRVKAAKGDHKSSIWELRSIEDDEILPYTAEDDELDDEEFVSFFGAGEESNSLSDVKKPLHFATTERVLQYSVKLAGNASAKSNRSTRTTRLAVLIEKYGEERIDRIQKGLLHLEEKRLLRQQKGQDQVPEVSSASGK